jgi:SAM-dependent methyltransferase
MMTVECPNCQHLADLTRGCESCGWHPVVDRGVFDLTTAADHASPVLASYLQNYDRIADDDLSAPILNLSYVEHQARNLARYAGNVAGRTVMDLGCGRGFLTRLLHDRGARTVVAVDISKSYLRQLAELDGVVPVLANAERLPFREAFDVIVSTDVMEHVLNVGSFLVSVNRSLRPGGVAIIRVPYRESLVGYSHQAGCKYDFVHLRTFDRRTVRDALGSAGLKVERTWFDGFNLSSPRPACVSTYYGQLWYGYFQKWALKHVADPASVTSWPWPLAGLVMTPKEIVVQARKVRKSL